MKPRPILYTDTINGKQVCSDNMWAVTTEFLVNAKKDRALLRALEAAGVDNWEGYPALPEEAI